MSGKRKLQAVASLILIIVCLTVNSVALADGNPPITITNGYTDEHAYLGGYYNIFINISGGSGVYWYQWKLEHFINDQWVTLEENTSKRLVSNFDNSVGWAITPYYADATKMKIHCIITDSESNSAEWSSGDIPIEKNIYPLTDKIDMFTNQTAAINSNYPYHSEGRSLQVRPSSIGIIEVWKCDQPYIDGEDADKWMTLLCIHALSPGSAELQVYDSEQLIKTITVNVISNKLSGDINNDGDVDGRDAVHFMKYLSNEIDPDTGEIYLINEENADVNGDYVVDEKDLLLLVKYLAEENVSLQ